MAYSELIIMKHPLSKNFNIIYITSVTQKLHWGTQTSCKWDLKPLMASTYSNADTHLFFQCYQPLSQLSLGLSCCSLVGHGEVMAFASFRALIQVWCLLGVWLTNASFIWGVWMWISIQPHTSTTIFHLENRFALLKELRKRLCLLPRLAESHGCRL